MKNRLFTIIIISLMLAFFPLFSVTAESGVCGDNLTWELNNGVLTISGNGTMWDYSCNDMLVSDAPWGVNVRTVKIEKGVTNIGKFAFSGSKLESISLPQGLITIGWGAFNDCTEMESITIPTSVKNIRGAAFAGCTRLKNLVIPNGVTSIDQVTFWGCGISSIKISDNVTSIGEGAFIECANLQSVVLPAKLKTIDECAFCFCGKLSAIYIPNTVTKIGAAAFDCCTSLKSVYYGGTVEERAKIIIEDDNKPLIDAKWQYAEPSNLTVDGLNYKLNHKKKTAVFYGANNKSITSIKIPDTIKVNGKKYKVNEIDANACKNLKKLANVTIGKNITKIGKNAFNGCKTLKTITIKTKLLTKSSIKSNAFKGINSKATIKCPKDKLKEYKKFLTGKGVPKSAIIK